MTRAYVKVFVTVPTAQMTRGIDGVKFENPVQSLLDALGELSAHGVGVIGDYDNVSFTYAKGRSRYRAIPGSGAHPTAGRIGEIHSEDEAVIAFTAPKDQLDTVIAAIRAHHPYEMPGIDVFDLVRFSGDGLK
jgi:hypothetical protein